MAYTPRTAASAGGFVGLSRYINANRNHSDRIGSQMAGDLEKTASDLSGEISQDAADGWIGSDKRSEFDRRSIDASRRLGLTDSNAGLSALLQEGRDLSSGEAGFDAAMIGTNRFKDLRDRFSGLSSMMDNVKTGIAPNSKQNSRVKAPAPREIREDRRPALSERLDRAKRPQRDLPFNYY